jgi:hypothetical protein
MILYAGNEKDVNTLYQVRIIDLNTEKTVSEYFEIDTNKAKYLHVIVHTMFMDNSSGTYYYNVFNGDTVYKIDNDMKPVYRVNLLNKNIPPSFYEHEYNDVMDFFQSLFRQDYAYGINLFLKGKENYLLSYWYDRKCRIAIVDKHTNGSIIDFHQMNENIVLSGYNIKGLPEISFWGGNGNEMILPLEPQEIVESFKDDAEKYESVKRAVRYTGEEQNVVLLLLGVK